MKTIAVILAGGSGSRLKNNSPKQFIEIDGKKIIEYSIDAFEKNIYIDEICIVYNTNYTMLMKQILNKNKYKKVKKIIPGGSERYESCLAAIKEYNSTETENIIFHDAARPFISNSIITKCVEALKKYQAITVAVKTTDTIISTDDNENITSMPDRKKLYNVQTPQGFKLKIIKQAYTKFLEDKNFTPTDDCSIIKKYLPQIPIKIIPGDYNNIKITHQQDLLLAENILHIINS